MTDEARTPLFEKYDSQSPNIRLYKDTIDGSNDDNKFLLEVFEVPQDLIEDAVKITLTYRPDLTFETYLNDDKEWKESIAKVLKNK